LGWGLSGDVKDIESASRGHWNRFLDCARNDKGAASARGLTAYRQVRLLWLRGEAIGGEGGKVNTAKMAVAR